MPLHDFRCRNCGETFEIRHGFNEKPKICPACQIPTLEQKLAAPAILFKGTGWYCTDSRRNPASASSSVS